MKHRRTPSRVSTRHLHDVPVASRRDWNLDLLACGHQILLQQVRVVRFGHGDAGVPEDLGQLVDVAAGLESPRSEGVAQHVRSDGRNLGPRRPFRQDLT